MRTTWTQWAAKLAAAGSTLAAAAAASGADNTILNVAPDDAWAVVHVPSAAAFLDPPEGSTLHRLMADEELAAFFAARFADVREAWEMRAEELDLDLEDLPRPTGPVGLAIVDLRTDGDAFDPESHVGALLWADFGEAADDAEEMIDQILDDAIDAGRVTFDETLVGDFELITVTRADGGEPADDAADSEPPDTITFGRIGSAFVVSEDAERAIEAAERALGEIRGGAINEVPQVVEAIATHPAGAEAFVVMQMAPVREGWMALLSEPGAPDPRALAEVLGLRGVESLSASLDLDPEDGAVAFAAHAVMRDKSGVFALAETEAGALSPPAFARGGTAAVARSRVEFDRIIPLIGRVLATFPEEAREQIAFALDQARGIAEPVLDSIGPELYQVTRYDEPFDELGATQLVATRVSNDDVVQNALSLVGGFAGAVPRDFAGVTVFDVEQAEQSGAVTGGWLYLGDTRAVEDAVRAGGGEGGEGSLARQDSFIEAANTMETAGVASGYMDLGRTLEWLTFEARRTAAEAEAFARAIDMSEADRALFLSASDWVDDLPETEAVTDVLGDFVWTMRSTNDGYRLRMLCLDRTR